MISSSPDTIRAALLLTNRVVTVDAKPLTAREFWQLCARLDPGDLVAAAPAEISELASVEIDEAARFRTLLDAATALSFEQERLADGGVELASALDDRFPGVLRERLGPACPPFLLVAGSLERLGRDALGVVGARDAAEEALDTAGEAARAAVGHGWQVVSGLARGVDQVAMAAALDAAGSVVGVPADGILRAARNAEVRRRVHAGELCIASPYGPDAPFTAGNAMGRNKIVYALSTVTLVVASDKDKGGTWAGAKESLDRGYAPVAVWTGPGARDGNHALVHRGARAVSEIDQLFGDDFSIAERPAQAALF